MGLSPLGQASNPRGPRDRFHISLHPTLVPYPAEADVVGTGHCSELSAMPSHPYKF